jgi:hypothetical protein
LIERGQVSRIRLRQDQQVVDQAEQVLAVAIDHVQAAAGQFRVQIDVVVAQQLQVPADTGQRRP